jgi:ubiquinone/menaquinone biosynthesis C-methylase UbiE
VIGFEREHERLELQARIGRIAEHLRHVPLQPTDRVLDAGCGSGSMSRLLAQQVPDGSVVGVDVNEQYLTYARARAEDEGVRNVEFHTGDVFALPFEDDSFDVVWCKYVLQWVNDPVHAVQEFARVTRPGGVIVSSHFDRFGIGLHPVDPELQLAAEAFFHGCVDPNVGPKVHGMFREVGISDISVDVEVDNSFTVVGPIDPDRRRNWEDQLDAAFSVAVRTTGSEEGARQFVDRFLAHHDDADTLTVCYLHFVTGRVPED